MALVDDEDVDVARLASSLFASRFSRQYSSYDSWCLARWLTRSDVVNGLDDVPPRETFTLHLLQFTYCWEVPEIVKNCHIGDLLLDIQSIVQ